METTLEGQLFLSPLAHRPRHVHTITDRFSMTNTYLIDDGRGLIVVDPGSVLNVRLLLGYLRRFLQRSPGDIDLIVLTHLPQDHAAGLEALRDVCRAPVAASMVPYYLQWKGREVMPSDMREKDIQSFEHLFRQRGGADLLRRSTSLIARYERLWALTEIWLEDAAGLPNHPDWRVIICPGYTLEGLCLHNPFSCELLCGDTMTVAEGNSLVVRGGIYNRRFDEVFRLLRTLEAYYLYPVHGRPLLSSKALTTVSLDWSL